MLGFHLLTLVLQHSEQSILCLWGHATSWACSHVACDACLQGSSLYQLLWWSDTVLATVLSVFHAHKVHCLPLMNAINGHSCHIGWFLWLLRYLCGPWAHSSATSTMSTLSGTTSPTETTRRNITLRHATIALFQGRKYPKCFWYTYCFRYCKYQCITTLRIMMYCCLIPAPSQVRWYSLCCIETNSTFGYCVGQHAAL